MNFLAHFYLSGIHDKELSLGNFLGDFIKGKKYMLYASGIRKGILLHRQIDSYTDHHPQVIKSKRRLYERHHHFSGVLVDMYYDHFLAIHFRDYSSLPLADFSDSIYKLLLSYQQLLPERASRLLPHMQRENWLYKYKKLPELDIIFQHMARRIRHPNRLAHGIEDLERHYAFFEEDFRIFFEDMQQHTQTWLRDYQGK